MIYTKTYSAPPVCEKEILRYAGVREEVLELVSLLKEILAEAENKLTYKVCYGEFELKTDGDTLDFGFMKTTSTALRKSIVECKRVVIFAATVGIELDRLIARYGTISPAKALMLQAIGAERIEGLCDAFCADMSRELATSGQGITRRFSPGYGDLSIDVQRDIFRVLDCSRKIGLSLNDSMLMSPSKSVTAIFGITDEVGAEKKSKACDSCRKVDCSFRRN